MLKGREDIRNALIESKTRFAVMAPDEFTTDIPEHSDLTPKLFWDRRARGLGATPVRPTVSCGEENLLCLRGDPWQYTRPELRKNLPHFGDWDVTKLPTFAWPEQLVQEGEKQKRDREERASGDAKRD